jgi:hypothetical protein
VLPLFRKMHNGHATTAKHPLDSVSVAQCVEWVFHMREIKSI